MNDNEQLEKEVKASLVDGHLSCASALKTASQLQVAPRAVGDVADQLGVRIINCQLGCFGMKKATHEELASQVIKEAVMEKVKDSAANGRLSCAVAHALGGELRINLKQVGDAATRLKVRIIDCQLGCFE